MTDSKEAEMAVIGALLIDPARFLTVSDILTAEQFFYPQHREAFTVISELRQADAPVDVVTVETEARKRKKDVGSLTECMEKCSVTSHAEYYAKIVASMHYDREILKAARDLAKDPTNESLEKVTKLVIKKEGIMVCQTFDYAKHLVDMVDEILVKSKGIRNYATGLKKIDEAWQGGTAPGELNCWAAATNVGKSMMLLNLMDKSAQMGHRCLYIGTEMSAGETVRRHLSMVTAIAPWKLRRGDVDLEEKARVVNAVITRVRDWPVHILDLPEPELKDVESAIIGSKAEIVFLDYLERFTLPPEDNLRLRVKEFMRRLKTMARRRNVVMHLASQLNRHAYGEEEKRPTMAEISESSAVEKESDRVMLIWTPKKKQIVHMAKGLEVIQAKNRHGQRGMILDLQLDERTLRITDDVPAYAE